MNLKELSCLLGLSPTTVSRALNGYPEVSEATRKRVLAAAAEHHYSPSLRAKALATGRSMLIGHVLPSTDRHEMVNPVFADFLAGASEAYRAAGYDIVLSVAAPDAEEQAYRDLAQKRVVDAVLLHAPRRDDGRLALLREIGLPFIVHGRASGSTETYNWVDVDNAGAFTRATTFLTDLGHTRIALVNGLEHMDFAHNRRAGYVAALGARGLRPDQDLMRSGEMTEEYGYGAAHALLDLPDPPTAFLVSSTITAFGISRAAGERGLELGRDVSVITWDDDLSYFRNGGAEAIFTALRSSVRDAGRRAASSLVDLVEDPDRTCQHVMETEFIIGRSTGPCPRTLERQKA